MRCGKPPRLSNCECPARRPRLLECFREHFDVSPSAYRDVRFEGASSAAEA